MILISMLLLVVFTMFFMVYSNPFWRVKFLRKLLRKKFGLIFFVSANDIFFKVIDFSKNTFRSGNKLYIILQDIEMYLKNVATEKQNTTEKRSGHFEIDINSIKYVEGIPCLFFDLERATPLSFSNPLPENMKLLLAEKVGAILDKEIAIAEAEALISSKKRIVMFLYILIIICAIVLVLSLMNFLQADTLGKNINNLANLITSLKNITA